MLERFQEARDKFIAKRSKLEESRSKLRRTAVSIVFAQSARKEWIMAREFFAEVARITQADITDYLQSTVSLAIDNVPTDKPLKLIPKFETRRNQQELDLYVQEGDEDPILLDSKIDLIGNSVEELAAFASKLCIASIRDPQPAPFQIHDEPFRALHESTMQTVLQMIKELQQELGLQIIFLTHRDDLSAIGDSVLNITKKKGVATVKQVKGGPNDVSDRKSGRSSLSLRTGGRGGRLGKVRKGKEESLQRQATNKVQRNDSSIQDLTTHWAEDLLVLEERQQEREEKSPYKGQAICCSHRL